MVIFTLKKKKITLLTGAIIWVNTVSQVTNTYLKFLRETER